MVCAMWWISTHRATAHEGENSAGCEMIFGIVRGFAGVGGTDTPAPMPADNIDSNGIEKFKPLALKLTASRRFVFFTQKTIKTKCLWFSRNQIR